jgi:esterase/lipase superfamily enzyme
MLRFVRVLMLALVAAVIFSSHPPSAQADVYVIESSVSDIKVGAHLNNDEVINIPAGASIRAVMPTGRTLTIRGPYAGNVGDLLKGEAQNEGLMAWMKTMLKAGGSIETTPGATKSVTRPRPKSIASDCVSSDQCTPVAVFFATNRNRREADNHISFGADRNKEMTLGSAIVTVPKSHGRGQIERPVYWNLTDLFRGLAEDPSRHFAIVKNGVTVFASMDDFVEMVKLVSQGLRQYNDHAFVFVHGFNVTFEGSLYRTAQIAYDLGTVVDGVHIPFAVPFLFSWPSKGTAAGYATDEDTARISVQHLRSFLDTVVNHSGARNVHVIAHSMGNQILLRVLEAMAKDNPQVAFNQVVLAAPDIDKDEFEQIAARVGSVARGVTLYASSSDTALAMSRGLRDGRARAGEVDKSGPVIIKGIDSIDVSAVGTDFLSTNHAVYIEAKVLINDMSLLLRRGLRPPPDRTPLFEQRGSSQAPYWVYPR